MNKKISFGLLFVSAIGAPRGAVVDYQADYNRLQSHKSSMQHVEDGLLLKDLLARAFMYGVLCGSSLHEETNKNASQLKNHGSVGSEDEKQKIEEIKVIGAESEAVQVVEGRKKQTQEKKVIDVDHKEAVPVDEKYENEISINDDVGDEKKRKDGELSRRKKRHKKKAVKVKVVVSGGAVDGASIKNSTSTKVSKIEKVCKVAFWMLAACLLFTFRNNFIVRNVVSLFGKLVSLLMTSATRQWSKFFLSCVQ